MLSITDLVTMCILQAIVPAVREAVTALTRGEKKGKHSSLDKGS